VERTTTLEYQSTNRLTDRWHRRRAIRIRYFMMTAGVVLALWFGSASCRVWLAHRRLMRAIDAGAAASNADARRLNRELQWVDSIRPLLTKPWRSKVVLYYPNGYASEGYVKIP
jgi:hypothetical protein